MKHLILFSLLTLVIFSCKKNNDPSPQPVDPSPKTSDFSNGILILNEGNFTWGNASLSFISRQSNTVQNNVFQSVNGRPLGDVAQSVTFNSDRAYLVVNNSQKIEVVNKNSLLSLGTITGFTSPRHMAFVNAQKAYVTDLYSNSVWIVDPQQMTITASIAVPGWTEQLIVHNDKAYVANTGRSHLMIIDTNTDQLTDSIVLSPQPASIVKDANSKLWVLCSGDGSLYLPALYRIDPAVAAVEQVYTFPSFTSFPSRLTLNPTRDSLYFLNGGVFKMSIDAGALPSQPLIGQGAGLFYGLDADPATGDIYVSDAVDYVQQGWVFRYRPSGVKVDSCRVGIIPGNFGFN